MRKNILIISLLMIVGMLSYGLGERNRSIQLPKEVDTEVTGVAEGLMVLDETESNTDQDYYYSFFKKKGLTITSFNYLNLTGEGMRAVFDTIGTGCGSCHYNEIHIFDGRKEIFVFYGEDSSLTPINGKGFKITQPLLKEGQSYAERNEMAWAIYQWDGKSFVKSKTSPNWVDMPQSPG